MLKNFLLNCGTISFTSGILLHGVSYASLTFIVHNLNTNAAAHTRSRFRFKYACLHPGWPALSLSAMKSYIYRDIRFRLADSFISSLYEQET